MIPPTYADALAACRKQWGDSGLYCYAHDGDAACPAFRSAEWSGEVAPDLVEQDGRLVLSVFDLRPRTRARDACEAWTLAGTPTPDAPLTPLPDAIAAAGRWLAARGATTAAKGP